MSSFRQSINQNVGIIDFFRDKTIFITGSTGFIAKVFVEKLLRALPTVRKVYLLLRANNAEAAMQRVQREIINSELFKILREKHGASYNEFMWSKIVPISGDLCKPYLDIDMNLAQVIKHEVDVIVHMGASTKWHARHDVSLEVNARAVSRIVDFALDCTKLVLFLHVSTVFATQDVPGVTFERFADMGQYREDGDEKNLWLLADKIIDAEMRIIAQVASHIQDEDDHAAELIKLGMRRSKYYKMMNNYQLTKAIGDMVTTKLCGKIPVVIVRPSFVGSTFKEPISGWIEGYKSLDPIILSYGTGQLEGFPANPSMILDLVPVDMVVNVVIAAMAKHGNEGKRGVNMYNVASSLTNPLLCRDLFSFVSEYFKTRPLSDSNGNVIRVKDMKFFESINEFAIAGLGSTTTSNSKLYTKFIRMAVIYEILQISAMWYDATNTKKLLGEMSLEENEMFNFKVECVNWRHYFTNIHIPRLIQHVLKKKALPPKL